MNQSSGDSNARPVFVLGAGARTGSTLVQRTLIGSRQALIWGEHGGVLMDGLQEIVHGMRAWLELEAEGELWRLRELWQDGWAPNVNPKKEAFLAGARAFLTEALDRPARELGFPRWGFKEIRYGRRIALLLEELYPDATILIVIRHPVGCLKSIKSTSWYMKDYRADPVVFLQRWGLLTFELVASCRDLRQARVVRYEDIVAYPDAYLRSLAEALAIPATCFDSAMMRAPLRGTNTPPRELDDRDREALLAPIVQRALVASGYTLESPETESD